MNPLSLQPAYNYINSRTSKDPSVYVSHQFYLHFQIGFIYYGDVGVG